MKVEEEDEEMSTNSPSKRPRRQTAARSAASENGLLWREEKELKKALYASLQESTRVRPNTRGPQSDSAPASEQPPQQQDADSTLPKKAKVHAQRKFAQGSLPNSPMPTPVKLGRQVQGISPLDTVFKPCKSRPKTEDFLTFLCLRGSQVLPSSLEFFNNCWPHNNGGADGDSECSEKSYYSDDGLFHNDSKSFIENGYWESGDRAKLTANEIAALHRQPSSKVAAVKRKLAACQIAMGKKNKLDPKQNRNKMRKNDSSQVSSSVAKRAKALKEKYRRFDNQQLSRKSEPDVDKRQTRGSTHSKNTRSTSLLTNNLSGGPTQRVDIKKKLLENSLRRAKLRQNLRSSQRTEPNDVVVVKTNARQVPRKAKLVPTIVEVDSEEEFENVVVPMKSKRSIVPLSNAEVKKLSKKEGVKTFVNELKRKEQLRDKEEQELTQRRVQRVVEKGRVGRPPGKSKKVIDTKRVTRSQGSIPEIDYYAFLNRVQVKVHRIRLEKSAAEVTSVGDTKPEKYAVKLRKGQVKTLVSSGSIKRLRNVGDKRTTVMKPVKREMEIVRKSFPVDLKDEMVAKKSAFVRVKGYKASIVSNARQKALRSGAASKGSKTKKTLKKSSPDKSDQQNTSGSGQLLSTPDRQGAAMMATIAGSSNDLPNDLDQDMMPMMLSSEEEIQGLMTRKFSGVFDDAFPTNALLMTSAQSGTSAVGAASTTVARGASGIDSPLDDPTTLVMVDDGSPSKSVVDASTNTCEEDILLATGALPTTSLLEMDEDDIPVALLIKNNPFVPVLKTPEKSTSTASGSSSGGKQKLGPAKKVKPGKLGKMTFVRNIAKKKEPFPSGESQAAKMVEAPLYAPTEEEFQDPLEFIRRVQHEAGPYGICRIIPPPSFKPECKVNDEMRFTALNQHVHKMLYRWGPNVQQWTCIRKHLASQGIILNQAPLIGGMELDLVRLYRIVQSFGGLQQVVEKKKWQRIADALHIPKTAQDRVNRLYDAYCKYLIAYDTLPRDEKERLDAEVKAEHEGQSSSTANQAPVLEAPSLAPVLVKVESKDKPVVAAEEGSEGIDEDEDSSSSDCVIKGRSISLSSFYRVARNTLAMWCKKQTTPEDIERDYWKLVTERQYHVVVHAGNIDSSVYRSGFSSSRASVFCKHPWNLKVLTNNAGTLLRAMGPVSGVTIPTIHVGMLYTTGCWHRDPHALPWIEYLHTGASKIWYGVPRDSSESFRRAMQEIMPSVCASGKPLWLPSDSAMVPPSLLVDHGASLSRTVQENGQFVVIFPGTFVSTIGTGYSISESVYFATPDWLSNAKSAFQSIRSSCEPAAFSLERLLFCLAEDARTQLDTLQLLLPWLKEIREREEKLRSELKELGVTSSERLPRPQEFRDKRKRSRGFRLSPADEGDNECDVCRVQCYLSKIVHREEESLYCLEHAIQVICSRKNSSGFKLAYSYHQDELDQIVDEMVQQIQLLGNKKKPKKSNSP